MITFQESKKQVFVQEIQSSGLISQSIRIPIDEIGLIIGGLKECLTTTKRQGV
jgi:hypothetical protein